MILSSKRLKLERLSEEHFEEYKKLELDPEVMKFFNRGVSTSESMARNFFNRMLDYQSNLPGFGAFHASDKSSGQSIGLGLLVHLELDPKNPGHEIGYRLHKDFWGQGFATEIASALRDYGFNQLKLPEIFGTTHKDHVVSQRILEKIGMKNIGASTYYGGSTLFKLAKATV